MRHLNFPSLRLAAARYAMLLCACIAFGPALADDTLFQALGGKEGIQKFTNEFVGIILEDPRIKESFKDTDMQRLALLLGEQFCDLAGGPCKYKGRDMKETHAKLGLNNANFNALAEDLQIAMERSGVPSSTSNKLVAKLAPMQRDVVTK